uniref:vesicle transport through interaction with t-SNAREs homolog 1B isoform X2 n=2 Tax=Myxine glutinosa TaxID=7769 RepID=UPI00358EF105
MSSCLNWYISGTDPRVCRKQWKWSIRLSRDMSSEKLEALQDEYASLYETMKSKLENQLPHYRGEEKKRLIRDVERSTEEANLLLQEMEEELKMAPPTYRGQTLSRLRGYHKELDAVQRATQLASQLGYSTRTDLLGQPEPWGAAAGADRDMSSVSAQRTQILQGTEHLGRTSESLARSHRIALETENIGHDIIDELGTQHDQLDRSRGRLVDTGENLSKSRKILNSMSRRLVTNKLLLSCIIILELAILGTVVYLKFFKK